ncbi:hypothetical protein A3Q56_07323 [Intoshia linei]|uniref:Uncharacterized protein n=1 Tax=Intoshia linei TaxID=1819745 RepID=A0A177AUA6_9BILA|nr:hypothetical protein A3Q56_07323 [Intoshia linei]
MDKIICETNLGRITLKGRPCELSGHSYVAIKNLYKNYNFFNSSKQINEKPILTYDKLVNHKYGFEGRIHRDDRVHAKLMGLKIYEEESSKPVGSRSSSVYGNFISQKILTDSESLRKEQVYNEICEAERRENVRVMRIRDEFYRRNGLK